MEKVRQWRAQYVSNGLVGFSNTEVKEGTFQETIG
jgi:hypothetical protein